MSLFGAIVRTVVNVVKLPVELPVAILKDFGDYSYGHEPSNVKEVIAELKREAEPMEGEK